MAWAFVWVGRWERESTMLSRGIELQCKHRSARTCLLLFPFSPLLLFSVSLLNSSIFILFMSNTQQQLCRTFGTEREERKATQSIMEHSRNMGAIVRWAFYPLQIPVQVPVRPTPQASVLSELGVSGECSEWEAALVTRPPVCAAGGRCGANQRKEHSYSCVGLD